MLNIHLNHIEVVSDKVPKWGQNKNPYKKVKTRILTNYINCTGLRKIAPR